MEYLPRIGKYWGRIYHVGSLTMSTGCRKDEKKECEPPCKCVKMRDARETMGNGLDISGPQVDQNSCDTNNNFQSNQYDNDLL